MEALPGRELAEWKAYFNLRPFTLDVLDHGMAQIAQVFYNANSKTSKGRDHFLMIKRDTKDAKFHRDAAMAAAAVREQERSRL